MLGIIHHKSLETSTAKSKSFKVILVSSHATKTSQPIHHHKPKPTKTIQENKCIYLSGIPENTQTKDIWSFFKKLGKFKDVTLPRKRDKFNNRYGFIHTENKLEAEELIKALRVTPFMNTKFYIAYAHSETPKKMGGKRPNSNNHSPRLAVHKAKPANKQREDSSKTPNESKVNSQIPTKSVITPLETNLNFTKELEYSVLLETINQESVDTVSSIVKGLGFEEVTIRSLGGFKFIAFFSLEEDLSTVDLDFLKIGFKSVKKVEDLDLIPARKVWVELHGILIKTWTETNFSELLKTWRTIISYSPLLDDLGSYKTPMVLIETFEMDKIDFT